MTIRIRPGRAAGRAPLALPVARADRSNEAGAGRCPRTRPRVEGPGRSGRTDPLPDDGGPAGPGRPTGRALAARPARAADRRRGRLRRGRARGRPRPAALELRDRRARGPGAVPARGSPALRAGRPRRREDDPVSRRRQRRRPGPRSGDARRPGRRERVPAGERPLRSVRRRDVRTGRHVSLRGTRRRRHQFAARRDPRRGRSAAGQRVGLRTPRGRPRLGAVRAHGRQRTLPDPWACRPGPAGSGRRRRRTKTGFVRRTRWRSRSPARRPSWICVPAGSRGA